MKRAIGLGLAVVGLVACGGSTPPPEAPVEKHEPRSARPIRPSFEMEQEIGHLDEAEVQATFARLAPKLMGCFERGSADNELLEGDLRFTVRIDSEGRVKWTYLSGSTLGDRQTERCMLDAVKAARWPEPVGGKEGQAQGSFDFEASPDVRPAVLWDSSQVLPVLPKLQAALGTCPGAKGPYRVTAYVNQQGKVLSAGVAAPDEEAEAASDCVVEAVEKLELSSPGSWPAKVSFELR